jgi:NAD(P)-dependent dehydrogenase (short-subunit alcohol dehydrogenase family)
VSSGALESLFGLTGRTAVVVGASGGLGAEAAYALAGAGANVGLIARRGDRLDSVAKELTDGGARAFAAVGDVMDRDSIRGAIDEVERALGNTWVLVYASGIARLRRAELHSRQDWDESVAVNLTGAFEVTQLVGTRMIERGQGGRIIFISSVAGFAGSPVHRHVGYSATKGGVNMLARQLAVEWAQHRITVNAIAPSYFPTDMTIDRETGTVPDAMRARIEEFTPMGRLGGPGETRTAVCFLAAPASSYVTGTIVPVDGGWSAW